MLFGVVLSFALVLPVLALIRWIMARRVQGLMLRMSKSAGSPLADFEVTPEVTMQTVPRLQRLDAASIPQDAVAARKEAAREARRLFFRWCRYQMLACAVYAGLPYLAALASGQDLQSEFLLGMLIVSAAYFIIILARLIFYTRQYEKARGKRPLDGLRRIFGTVFLGLFKILIQPATSWLPFLLVLATAAFMAFVAAGASLVVTVAILAAMVIHVGLWWSLSRQVQGLPNRKLLILRVFGMNRNAFLTFNYLLRAWRHFGSSFTIVDPSYFRYQYRGLSDRNIAVVFWLTTLVSLMVAAMVEESADPAAAASAISPELLTNFSPLIAAPIVAFLMTVGYLLMTIARYFWIPRSFARDTDQISARLARLEKSQRRMDLTFRDLHMYCYDNTWRVAVSAFVSASDVVLMDLRGFSKERKGCEYEVDFLLDTVPIDQVVFLVDQDSDLDAVYQLIRARWAELRVISPNIEAPDPVATIYVSGDERAADVMGLIDLLFIAAARRKQENSHCRIG